MLRFKEFVLETESAVPANAMGSSSTVAGSGAIDMPEPVKPSKKRRRSNVVARARACQEER